MLWPSIECIDWAAREDGAPYREQCWPLVCRIDGHAVRTLGGQAASLAARSGCVVDLNPTCIHRCVCAPQAALTLLMDVIVVPSHMSRIRRYISSVSSSICLSFMRF